MPDYDPQSIPILDDVIVSNTDEKSSTEDTQAAAESFIADTEEAETNATENNLDLFLSDSTDTPAEELILDNPNKLQEESKISSIEHISDTDTDESFAEESVDASDDELEVAFESALIDYDADIEVLDAGPDITLLDEAISEIETVDDRPSNPASPAHDMPTYDTPALETPESLESIVNDVVKHLMPDLEQQLRYLVQQALEERLPQEIMQSVTAAKEKTDDC